VIPGLPQFGPEAARHSAAQRRLMATAVVVVVLGLTVSGAAATSGPGGGINRPVERIAAGSSGLLGDVAAVLPLGFAFAAGMVSSVNPCGFALLPAYLGLFLSEAETPAGAGAAQRLWRALLVGGAVTTGFVTLFTVIGLTVNVGARVVVAWIPWFALALGVMLVLAGGYRLAGGLLHSSLPQRLASRLDVGRPGPSGYFAFGLAYGLASLSCTLPIFLAVVGTTVTTATVWSSLGSILMYGLGMGTVVLTLTLAVGVFRVALAARLRPLLPHLGVVGTIALFAAGSYLVYYWLTVGGLLGGQA